VPSTTLCFFARRTQAVNGWSKMNEYTHNDLDQSSSLGARDPLDVAFGTCFALGSVHEHNLEGV